MHKTDPAGGVELFGHGLTQNHHYSDSDEIFKLSSAAPIVDKRCSLNVGPIVSLIFPSDLLGVHFNATVASSRPLPRPLKSTMLWLSRPAEIARCALWLNDAR